MKSRIKRPGHLIMDIVIGALCVLFVGIGFFTIKMINEEINFSYDVESFYYRLQDEDYSQMVEMYHTNEASNVKANEELKQYYGIAKYFEAASYYNVYETCKEQEKMNKYQVQMKNAEKEMGELSFVKDDINKKLGIR